MTLKTARTRKERVKRIEYHLRNYHQYLVAIENIDRQIRLHRADLLPSIPANYQLREGSVGAFVVRSGTEEAALRSIERGGVPHELAQERAEYSIITESIDAALKSLNDTERKFIKRRYFDRVEMNRVAEELGHSTTHTFDIRKAIFDKLLISLSVIEDL